MRKLFFSFLLALLVPMVARAQEPYAVLSDNNTVLTFYYDDQKASRNGKSIGPFTAAINRPWHNVSRKITSVVFDDSFANCTTLTSTANWFNFCTNLTSITDISNLKTDNVTDMSNMFYACFGLTSLDLTGFKTDNVTNMICMFDGCSSLTNLDLSGFKTDNVTNMSQMFRGCSGLMSLDVTGFKTDNVTDMSYMFEGCSGLTSLDLSGFKTDKVTNMSWMFWKCSGLTSLDVSGFKTDNVTKMSGMFEGCSGLTSLNLSGFKTDNVTEMWDMFYDCSSLSNLDLSGFKTDNVTSMSCMFLRCSSLKSLDVSGFKTDNVTNMYGMFYECSSLKSLDLTGFKTDNVTNMSQMFRGCSSLASLDLSGFKTDNVTDMTDMFAYCRGLTSLDVSGFNTDNVTDMSCMFSGCSALTSLDLSNFNTSNLTYNINNFLYGIESMFKGCSALTTIMVGDGWTTANLTGSADVFKDCTSLVGGAGTRYDMSHIDYTYARIDGGSDYPGYFTAKATGVQEPYAVLSDNNSVLTFYFDNQKAIRNGMDVGPFTHSYNQNRQHIISSGWDKKRESITSVVFDASFAGCTTLTSTAFWFFGFENLTSITGISNLKTDNVTDMTGMFFNCYGLTSLDVTGFKTDNVTSMEVMFSACSGLTSLDVTGFNTEKVTNMNSMFLGCSGLTSLDVTGFTTDNVTDMGSMFADCRSLTSLDVTGFKTDKVTDMSYMFHSCSGLTSLDLSSFKTDNVTNMDCMFYNCSGLTTIYAGDGWSTANVVGNCYNMFTNCTSLVGGAGTHYGGSDGLTYARIDGGSDNPGYFTAKAGGSGGGTSSEKCAKPIIKYVGGKLKFECETEGVEFISHFSTPAGADNNTSEVEIPTTYTVSVYAKKDGYLDSETVTADIDVRGLKGDVDGDGVVDIADAVRIVNFIVGKIDALAPHSEINLTEPE